MRAFLPGLFLVLALAACGSTPPPVYVVIDSLPPAADGTRERHGPLLGIGSVMLPDYLDRLLIVQRGGDNRLQMRDSERWGEPLERAVPRVLAANLGVLLADYRIVQQPWAAAQQPDWRLTVRISRLDALRGDAVVLLADWQLAASGDATPPRSWQGSFRAPLADNRASSIAAAHGEVLAALATAIGNSLGGDTPPAASGH